MEIRKAMIDDLNAVTQITHETMREVFPHYYPQGAIEVFFSYNSRQNIETDIKEGRVYLLIDDGESLGTVTIKGNEIDRLFVYPRCQGKGYGTALLDFAEKEIAGQGYGNIMLGATLSGKHIYKRHGYVETEYYTFKTANGDCLCVDMMSKGCKFTLDKSVAHVASI